MIQIKELMSLEPFIVKVTETENGNTVENPYVVLHGLEGKRPTILGKLTTEGIQFGAASAEFRKKFIAEVDGTALPQIGSTQHRPSAVVTPAGDA